jgi:UPF0755 protein
MQSADETDETSDTMAPRHARRTSRRVARRRAFVAVVLLAIVGAFAYSKLNTHPQPQAKSVEVRAGWTADQVAAAMVTSTGWDQSTVTKAFSDPRAAGVPAGVTSVEGWLAPGVYSVSAADTPATLIAQMVAHRLSQVTTLGLEEAATRQHSTVAQLITVASVAQAEAIPSQYGQVARVIINRLAAKMPLQMDATLNYANKTHFLAHSAAALTDPSAYNSYIKVGLPPTPIGNPDQRALLAAASPPQGKWLYFVLTDHDGTQLFTADYNEFLRAKAKAQADGLF